MQQPGAVQQSFKMMVGKDDPAIHYFHRFKQPIPITKTPVPRPENGRIGGNDLSVKINVVAYYYFPFTVVG